MIRNSSIVFIFVACLCVQILLGQPLKIAKLKYDGGGDWYANKTALPNLISFCNKNLNTNIHAEENVVEIGSFDLFLYPYVYMTGHGHFELTDRQSVNLRNYLLGGGFLHIDDNYGLDSYVRKEMKKVFPEYDFVDVPLIHPIYHQKYEFDEGLPKIHKHDDNPPRGLGIFHQGKLICFYSYESDLGNGWEDQRIYDDPEELRQKALKMGTNIIAYVFLDEG